MGKLEFDIVINHSIIVDFHFNRYLFYYYYECEKLSYNCIYTVFKSTLTQDVNMGVFGKLYCFKLKRISIKASKTNSFLCSLILFQY